MKSFFNSVICFNISAEQASPAPASMSDVVDDFRSNLELKMWRKRDMRTINGKSCTFTRIASL